MGGCCSKSTAKDPAAANSLKGGDEKPVAVVSTPTSTHELLEEEEEAEVKEVLSETPITSALITRMWRPISPSSSSSINKKNPLPLPGRKESGDDLDRSFVHVDYCRSHVVSSPTESSADASARAAAEDDNGGGGGGESTGEAKKLIMRSATVTSRSRSPANKIQKMMYNHQAATAAGGGGGGGGSRKRESRGRAVYVGCQSARSSPSPARARGTGNMATGISGHRRIPSASNLLLKKRDDIGERSGRRCGSPSAATMKRETMPMPTVIDQRMTTASSATKAANNTNGRFFSPQRIPQPATGRRRGHMDEVNAATSGAGSNDHGMIQLVDEEEEEGKESNDVDNPLVSMECFIFL